MLRFLRILLALAILAALALLAIIFVPPRLTKPSEVLAVDWQPPPGAGEYALRMADCAACHTAPGGAFLSGGRAIESPMGTIWASNITPDRETGIGGWTLDQFRAALVDGIAPGGRHLYPAMPYENYRKMSEQDIRAIYLFIMDEVPPVPNRVTATRLSFPFNQRWGIRLWNWAALDKPGFTAPHGAGSAPEVARGAYLVEGPGHCGACHSPRSPIMAQDGTDGSDKAFLSGGEIGGWPAPDLRGAGSALQKWSDQDLADYLTTGRNAHDTVAGEMKLVVQDSLQYMTPADTRAMVAYLRSISAVTPAGLPDARPDTGVQSLAERLAAAGDATTERLKAATGLTEGELLYLNNCAACHMVDGKGAPGVFPALAGNALVTARSPVGLTQIILGGAEAPSTAGRPERLRMPAFAARLSDQDVATLETFLRTGWGNAGSPVTAPDIAALRR